MHCAAGGIIRRWFCWVGLSILLLGRANNRVDRRCRILEAGVLVAGWAARCRGAAGCVVRGGLCGIRFDVLRFCHGRTALGTPQSTKRVGLHVDGVAAVEHCAVNRERQLHPLCLPAFAPAMQQKAEQSHADQGHDHGGGSRPCASIGSNGSGCVCQRGRRRRCCHRAAAVGWDHRCKQCCWRQPA